MKNYIVRNFKKLLKDESAQGATEYILLLVVVVGLLLTFRKQIIQIVSGKVSNLGNEINQFNP